MPAPLPQNCGAAWCVVVFAILLLLCEEEEEHITQGDQVVRRGRLHVAASAQIDQIDLLALTPLSQLSLLMVVEVELGLAL